MALVGKKMAARSPYKFNINGQFLDRDRPDFFLFRRGQSTIQEINTFSRLNRKSLETLENPVGHSSPASGSKCFGVGNYSRNEKVNSDFTLSLFFLDIYGCLPQGIEWQTRTGPPMPIKNTMVIMLSQKPFKKIQTTMIILISIFIIIISTL